MVHKSTTAFLEPKMLLLSIFLVSCCLPGSMEGAVEEFQENLKDLVELLANKKVFLPVSKGKFQCSHVPCQLKKTIEGLKASFDNDPARTHISLMEKNMNHITSTLKKTHTQPQNTIRCPMKELELQKALGHLKRYFEKVNENCWESR